MRALKTLAAALLLQVAVSASSQTLIGITNQNWQYFTTIGGPPAGWQNVGFDDSTWLTGRGLFGNDTGYPYPFVSTFAGPSTGGPNTAFFRTTFNWVGSTIGVVLTLTNFLDDGAVFYLNGTEIMRTNMPTQATVPVPDYTTFASGTISEGTTRVYQLALDSLANGSPNPIVAGVNVVAVSVHNNSSTSSDTVFGLAISGAQIQPPCTPAAPANVTAVQCRNATFTVVIPANCGIPAPTIQWFRNVGAGDVAIAGATGTSVTVSNVGPADAGQYFVQLTNPSGSTSSGRGQLTVNADIQGPRVVSVVYFGGANNEFDVTFDEPVDEVNATDPFNYRFDPEFGSSINGANAVRDANNFALVRVEGDSPIVAGVHYTYVIGISSELVDLCAGNTSPAGLTGPVTVPGPISVRSTGAGPYAFDVAPYKEEFTTAAFPGGADGTTDTPALFDAKVQTLDAATINLGLQGATGLPPAAGGMGRWASDGHYLITRPTGTAGDVILAHLINESGETRLGLTISYNLTTEIPVVEEVQGHLVYYSFTGAPGSWQQIPGISGDRTTGAKSAILDFTATPWTVGSALYILFADDNGSGSPDDALEIDNFAVSIPSTTLPPSITQQPRSVTTNEGNTVELSVVASGSPPLQYQWFKGGVPVSNGGNISGATTANLIISSALTGNAGSYTVRVSNNNPPAVDSTAATVVINPDTIRPHLARAVSSANGTTITLTFNEPVGTVSAETEANYTLTPAVAVNLAVVGPANTVTLTTAPRALGTAYSLRIAGVTDAASAANPVDPNPTIVSLSSASLVANAGWADTWQFNTNNLDATPTWKDAGFVPGADWGSGPALFGLETSAAVLAAAPTPIATPLAANSDTAAADRLVTTYFRKSITLPALPAGATYMISHYTDDGFIAYLDGVEIPGGRYGMPAGAVTFTTRSSGIPGGEATMNSFPFTATAGTHTLAVELHQAGTTSSDVLFGMEVRVVGGPGPNLSISRAGTGDINLGWTADSAWQLRGAANVAGPYTTTTIPAGTALGKFTLPAASATNNFFYHLHYISLP